MRAVPPVLILILAGCAASPPRAFDSSFDRAWDEDLENRAVQSRDEYLKWVGLFYDGSTFVTGWTQRQAELCGALGPEESRVAGPRLEEFGRLVAAEWAKDNKRRKIDSALVGRIADILALARDAGKLLPVIDELTKDVRAILAGDRPPASITVDRYGKILEVS